MKVRASVHETESKEQSAGPGCWGQSDEGMKDGRGARGRGFYVWKKSGEGPRQRALPDLGGAKPGRANTGK